MGSPRLSSDVTPDSLRDSHSRWLAMKHRLPASHSSFVYGVISTKIYCRPTCSARPARRANVVFYDTKDDARRDGFRPCRRCKPDDDRFFGDREEVVTKTLALLRIRRGNSIMEPGPKGLAKEVGVTPAYLCRAFKQTLGMTIGAYMIGFEREPDDIGIEMFPQSPGDVEPITRSPGEDCATSASIARNNSVISDGWTDQPIEAEYLGFSEVDLAHILPPSNCLLNEEVVSLL